MLIGEHQHNIDVKGRVFIPARFRDDLGEHFIVTKGLDSCLFIYSQDEWLVLDAKIRALPMSKSRRLQLFFFSSAVDVEADKQGRIVLPQNLREFASLTRDVVIIGASSRVEIWDKQKWQDACSGITLQTITEAMDTLGF
jgi:MraZ protein